MSHYNGKSYSRLSCRHFKWEEAQMRKKLIWRSPADYIGGIGWKGNGKVKLVRFGFI